MANGYDGFNVAMGLMADTFDEDEAKRREARAEKAEIRRENRADTRLIEKENRINMRADAVMQEQRNFLQTNNERLKLIELKDEAAALGLPFEGLSRHELIRDIAVAKTNIGPWSWFMTNKQYIDQLPMDASEAAYQEVLGIQGPLNLEALKEQPPEKLLELQSRLQTPVESIAKTERENRIRKLPSYQKNLKRLNQLQAIAGKYAYQSIAPTMMGVAQGLRGPTASHLEIAGRLMNNPEFTSMMNADGEDLGKVRTQLFLQNPTAFFAKAYDARGTGTGMGYLTMEQGIKLSALYEFAKEEVRSELSEIAQSGKPMTKDNTAALEWLNKELELTISQRDKASQRETFAKVWPEMLNEISTLMDPKTVEGSLLRQDTHSWLNEFIIKGEEQERQGEQPTAGQGRTLPFPGDPNAAKTPLPPQAKAPLPQPKTPPVVTVEGGLPAQTKLDAAKQILGEGYGEGLWSQRPWFRGALTPEKMVNEAADKISKRKRIIESRLQAIMATRDPNNPDNVKVGQTTEGEVAQFRRFSDPDNQPFRFQLGDTSPERAAPALRNLTLKEIQSRGAEALKLYGELDTINAQLKVLQGQAERQTGIRIPGLPNLGAGQRQ